MQSSIIWLASALPDHSIQTMHICSYQEFTVCAQALDNRMLQDGALAAHSKVWLPLLSVCVPPHIVHTYTGCVLLHQIKVALYIRNDVLQILIYMCNIKKIHHSTH